MAAPLSLCQATLSGRREIYDAYIAAGKGTPFLYPWDSLPALYLFLGIVIRPHLPRSLAVWSGYVTFAAVVFHSGYVVVNRRTIGFAGGYGIGLACTWGMIMTGVLLLVHEPEKDFIRLEIREGVSATTYVQTNEGSFYSADKDEALEQLRKRPGKGSAQIFVPNKSKRSNQGATYRLVWQTFPKDAWHCIDWTVDFITSFRGPNWNFRIPTSQKIKTIPPPPGYKVTRAIEASILANETESSSGLASSALQRESIINFVKYYFLVDLIKSIIVTDPYFLGLRPLTSTSPWPGIKDHPFLTKASRLSVAISSVVICLSFIFSLSPLCFYTVLPRLIPQSTLLKITKSPLYDPRMYEPFFSSLHTQVSTSGLSGFWGQGWHQMFRYGISEPSRPLIKSLNLNPKSLPARTIQLVVAFALTGSIHMIASFTTFSVIPSKPLNPFLFFIVQALGITVQTALAQFLRQQMKITAPVWARQVTNTAFVIVWLWYTGPLLADDFARGGTWLFEPVPISFFRGLTGGGWWHWGGRWVSLWRSEGLFGWGIAVW